MEQQLAKYRAEKQSRLALDSAKKPLLGKNLKTDVSDSEESDDDKFGDTSFPANSAAQRSTINADLDRTQLGPVEVKPAELSPTDRRLNRATLVIKCLLWLVLMVLFVKLEFGAVFFVVSCLYLIWKNLRSGPKKAGELSAYSVFNPNFETIEGTLTAEQFEREIKFGSGAVH